MNHPLQLEISPPCYGDLGCFPIRDPLTVYGVPESLKELNLTFKLFSNENINNSIDFNYDFDENELSNSTFASYKGTIFIIGGVNSSFDNDGWNGELKNSILNGKPGQFNVFGLNWLNTVMMFKATTVTGFEMRALANVEVIGSALAAFIERLVKYTALKYSHIHLIGDGIGANIASHASKKISSSKISRITGVNPKISMYSETALGTSDAKYVETLYTDYNEYSDPIGLINFYVNGGAPKAICSETRVATATMSCHDKFAHEIIRIMPENLPQKCEFVGYSCSSYDDFEKGLCMDCGDNNEKCFIFSILGINEPTLRHYYRRQLKDRKAHRKYYFKTLDGPPFCLYHYGLVIHFASPLAGKISVAVHGSLSELNFDLELSSTEPEIYQTLLTNKNGLGQLLKVILTSLEPNPSIRISLFMIKYLSNIDPGVRDEWSANMTLDESASSEKQITLVPSLGDI